MSQGRHRSPVTPRILGRSSSPKRTKSPVLFAPPKGQDYRKFLAVGSGAQIRPVCGANPRNGFDTFPTAGSRAAAGLLTLRFGRESRFDQLGQTRVVPQGRHRSPVTPKILGRSCQTGRQARAHALMQMHASEPNPGLWQSGAHRRRAVGVPTPRGSAAENYAASPGGPGTNGIASANPVRLSVPLEPSVRHRRSYDLAVGPAGGR